MEKYLIKLYKQYCDAYNIEFDIKKLNSTEFINWIIKNKKLSKKYKIYLTNIGYISSKYKVEIGKGKYDSISDDDIKIISPYAETLGKQNSRLIIANGEPIIKRQNKLIIPNQELLLTHNPYDDELSGWKDIHNNGIYDISVGVYGNIYDKNYKKKLYMIKELSRTMNDDFIIDYETDNDEYYCSIHSKRKVLSKVLIR